MAEHEKSDTNGEPLAWSQATKLEGTVEVEMTPEQYERFRRMVWGVSPEGEIIGGL